MDGEEPVFRVWLVGGTTVAFERDVQHDPGSGRYAIFGYLIDHLPKSGGGGMAPEKNASGTDANARNSPIEAVNANSRRPLLRSGLSIPSD